MVWPILTNPVTYLTVAGLALFAYGIIAPIAKKIPIIGRKQNLILIGLGGFLLASGILSGVIGSAGTASLTGSNVPANFRITDLQVTTSFTTEAGGSIAQNSNVDDLMDLRMTDAQSNETDGYEEVNGTGIITVTRSGSLDPYSCTVKAILPSDYADEAGDDGRRYNILEKTTVGEYEAYLQSGAVATVNSPKGKTSLSFADGSSTATLGVAMEVDEEGHDALNQYSYKDVVVDVCGKPFTFRIHRMD